MCPKHFSVERIRIPFVHSWNWHCACTCTHMPWETEFKLNVSDLEPQFGKEPGSEPCCSLPSSFLCVLHNVEPRTRLACRRNTLKGNRTLSPEKILLITEVRPFLHALHLICWNLAGNDSWLDLPIQHNFEQKYTNTIEKPNPLSYKTTDTALQNYHRGTSLVAQWLRICLPMQGTQVQSLVWEDPTCLGATKPLRHNYWACALEPVSHNYWARAPRARAPQQEKPLQ